jgi:hypothetical protein
MQSIVHIIKHDGYKLDYTIDAQHGVPLDYIPMEITCDEGKNLKASQEHISSLGMRGENKSC